MRLVIWYRNFLDWNIFPTIIYRKNFEMEETRYFFFFFLKDRIEKGLMEWKNIFLDDNRQMMYYLDYPL